MKWPASGDRPTFQSDYRVNFKHILRTSLMLVISLPFSVQAQDKLILPSGHEAMRELINPAESGPCTTCGIVTDVRSKQREVQKRTIQPVAGGPELIGTPVIGKGDAVKRSKSLSVESSYIVTVRYENGQYAAFEQDDKPAVKKGDPIRVVEGRVNFR
jgi:hypothetical protein